MKKILVALLVLCSLQGFAQPTPPQFVTYNGTLDSAFVNSIVRQNGRWRDVKIPARNLALDTIYTSNDSVYYVIGSTTYYAGSISGGGGGGSYSAGYGLSLSSTTFRVDTSVIQKKMAAGTGIAISGNTIYATGGGSSYTFGNGLTESSGTVTLGGTMSSGVVFLGGSANGMSLGTSGSRLSSLSGYSLGDITLNSSAVIALGGSTITISATPSVSDSSTNAANTKFVKQAIEANNVLYAYTFTVRETPSGTVNGSNAVFTLADTPIAGSEMVFLNGLLQDVGGGNDYTISGAVITFNTAPLSGSKIRVFSIKQ